MQIKKFIRDFKKDVLETFYSKIGNPSVGEDYKSLMDGKEIRIGLIYLKFDKDEKYLTLTYVGDDKKFERELIEIVAEM